MDAVFLGVDVELLFGEEDGSSRWTRVPVRKGHNFWSDRRNGHKYLHEFLDDVFLGVNVVSLLGEAEGSSR
jgi:hypothetical protein